MVSEVVHASLPNWSSLSQKWKVVMLIAFSSLGMSNWWPWVHPINEIDPDSKVHGAYMGPTWGRQDPGGSHVGPIRGKYISITTKLSLEVLEAVKLKTSNVSGDEKVGTVTDISFQLWWVSQCVNFPISSIQSQLMINDRTCEHMVCWSTIEIQWHLIVA